MSRVAQLVHTGDLDELVREIDAAASRADHDTVLALRRGCLDAVEQSGRQLWGPAAYAAYRLVLQAPPGLAVDTLLGAPDRHTLGPLTEVVAQHHDWAELAGMVPPGPVAGTVAVERVLRGEDLADDPRAETHHLDLPARTLGWEGRPPRVEYRARDVLAPAPVPRPTGPGVPADRPAAAVDDPELVAAWELLVAPWAASPNGRVAVTVADGSAAGAVARLAPRRDLHPIMLSDAVSVLAWAAASGGAGGRRRGGAAGRSAAWWALRVLVDHEPGSDPDLLHEDLSEWSWFLFDGLDDEGWTLRLAAEHVDGWSLAVDAHDPPPEDLVLPAADEPEGLADVDDDPADADPWAAIDRAIRGVGEAGVRHAPGDDPAST